MLVFPSGGLLLWWVRPFLADESLQFSLYDKGFYLLLQVVMFRRVVTVVMVKMTVLVSGPFVGVFFQLARPCQGCLVLDLHQDLINRGCQRGEAYEPPSGGLECLSSCRSPVFIVFRLLSCHTSFCLSRFLGFSSRASNASSAFMYLVAR